MNILCHLLYASLLISCAHSIKPFCSLNKDANCDDYWLPVPHLDAALVGYDISTGNPLSSNSIEDPGLKKQIFNLTIRNNEEIRLEAGIGVRDYVMCSSEWRVGLATNLESYMDLLMKSSLSGKGYKVGLEAEENGEFEGQLPKMIHSLWGETPEFYLIKEFFSESRGALALFELMCLTHKVDISSFLIPHFTDAFLAVLQFLEKQDTEVRQNRAFKRFISDYGTHYLSSTLLGNKISVSTFFSAFERLKYGKEKILKCGQFLATSTIFFPKSVNESNHSDCFALTDKILLSKTQKYERRQVTRFGSAFNSETQDWDLTKVSPIPIRYELTPIVNLFTKENLDFKYNISSSKILYWFLPKYLKYCNIFNYECHFPSGCGFDDNCSFDEKCIWTNSSSASSSEESNYNCQINSWADVTNWPTTSESFLREFTPPNMTWFRTKDIDTSNGLSTHEIFDEILEPTTWYTSRYQRALDKLFIEADRNENQRIEETEYITLHKRHPWFKEQISFSIINTDENSYLSKEELLEASKISPDMQSLNFSLKQLNHLIEGLLSIGDIDGNKRISFDEYIVMSNDIFVDNFSPNSLKRIWR